MNLLSQTALMANRKLHARVVFQGLPVSVENRAGSYRSGIDPGGKPWRTLMTYDYGYIRGTNGKDGDAADCFIGPHKDAPNAYIIRIKRPPDFKTDDEDKCFLGFDSPENAKRAFAANYDNPKFFGSMQTVPMGEFKRRVAAGQVHAYGTSDGAVKAWDTRGRGRVTPSEAMVSPNIEKDMTIDEAIRALRSDQQASFAAIARDVVGRVDNNGMVANSLGDWVDGAENSIAMSANATMETVRYMAAKMGLQGRQKQVLAFHAQPGGRDALWILRIGSGYTLDGIRDTLTQNGLNFRTFVPVKDGLEIHVFDEGTKMSNQISEVATAYGSNIEKKKGIGEFIGGETRAEGAKAFHPIVDAYEIKHGIRAASNRHNGIRSVQRIRLHRSTETQVTALDRAISLHSWGEPGALVSHSHIEPRPTYHPPSLRNPQRMPVDDPNETDDKYGDVTNRKKAQKFREALAKKKGFDSHYMGIKTTALGWAPASGELGNA